MKQIKCGLLVVLLLTLVSNIFCEQTFYPNGRYGRRSVVEANAGGQDQSMESRHGFMIINAEFRCNYTGYSNYFRCTQRPTIFGDIN